MDMRTSFIALLAAGSLAGFATGANAGQTLTAAPTASDIKVDGNISDWDGISGITVPLAGKGGVDSVEMRAAIKGDRIYIMAVWADSSENILHKPYRWDDAAGKYKRDKQKEDRFAISLKMSGQFSASKIDGSPFEADVWHWKASRSNPVGIAHDKMWKVSKEPFEKAKEWPTPDGGKVYLARLSDAGDRLYKPIKYKEKQGDLMPRYDVNQNAKGSIADIAAKGVWKDGHWYLEMSRALDTGHADDAVINPAGSIEMAIAAFNNVDGRHHSVSEVLILNTTASGS